MIYNYKNITPKGLSKEEIMAEIYNLSTWDIAEIAKELSKYDTEQEFEDTESLKDILLMYDTVEILDNIDIDYILDYIKHRIN